MNKAYDAATEEAFQVIGALGSSIEGLSRIRSLTALSSEVETLAEYSDRLSEIVQKIRAHEELSHGNS